MPKPDKEKRFSKPRGYREPFQASLSSREAEKFLRVRRDEGDSFAVLLKPQLGSIRTVSDVSQVIHLEAGTEVIARTISDDLADRDTEMHAALNRICPDLSQHVSKEELRDTLPTARYLDGPQSLRLRFLSFLPAEQHTITPM